MRRRLTMLRSIAAVLVLLALIGAGSADFTTARTRSPSVASIHFYRSCTSGGPSSAVTVVGVLRNVAPRYGYSFGVDDDIAQKGTEFDTDFHVSSSGGFRFTMVIPTPLSAMSWVIFGPGVLLTGSSIFEGCLLPSHWVGVVLKGPANQLAAASGITISQPTCVQDGKSSFWVGFDGQGSSTVEQAGIEEDCASGRANIFAFWELFPLVTEQRIPLTGLNGRALSLVPGDRVDFGVYHNGSTVTFSAVAYNSNGQAISSPWNLVKSTDGMNPQPQYQTMECIGEDPQLPIGPHVVVYAPTTHFGTVVFTDCSAELDITPTTPIGNFTIDYDLVSYGQFLAAIHPWSGNYYGVADFQIGYGQYFPTTVPG